VADLTDNVNQLAANLTTQVRAIAEVATAVTKGDLTRSITVEARGEVAALKDNVNQMIANLRDTTQKNTEQDWLKTNLAKFTRMLQGQRDLAQAVARLILRELAPLVRAQQGVFYIMDQGDGATPHPASCCRATRTASARAWPTTWGWARAWSASARSRRTASCSPRCPRTTSRSARASARPAAQHRRLPVLFEGEVKAVVELASFYRFTDIHLTFLDQLTESIGIVLNTIAAACAPRSCSSSRMRRPRQLLTETSASAAGASLSSESASSSRRSCSRPTRSWEKARSCCSCRTPRSSARTRRSSRREDRARGEGPAARPHEQVQVRVPRQHVARAAHAAQQPAHPGQAAVGQPEGNLDAKQVEFARTIHGAGSTCCR
jgi:HAMP domain-containing protein